jgi:hypothetical protein
MSYVNLLPADRKSHEEDHDDSVLPSDWLEHTGEIHPLLDLSLGKGTWKSLFMGDLKTQYGNFYMGYTKHFQMVHQQHAYDLDLDTRKETTVLQKMNAKCNINPDMGVDKLKKEQNQALKDHVKDLMACLTARSHHWTAYSNRE